MIIPNSAYTKKGKIAIFVDKLALLLITQHHLLFKHICQIDIHFSF